MGQTLLGIYRGEGPAGLFKWGPPPCRPPRPGATMRMLTVPGRLAFGTLRLRPPLWLQCAAAAGNQLRCHSSGRACPFW